MKYVTWCHVSSGYALLRKARARCAVVGAMDAWAFKRIEASETAQAAFSHVEVAAEHHFSVITLVGVAVEVCSGLHALTWFRNLNRQPGDTTVQRCQLRSD